jgi:hypothetical protein
MLPNYGFSFRCDERAEKRKEVNFELVPSITIWSSPAASILLGSIKYEDLVFMLCAALPNVGRGCLYI